MTRLDEDLGLILNGLNIELYSKESFKVMLFNKHKTHSDWQNPQCTHINRLPGSELLIPYCNLKTALKRDKSLSPYFKS